MKKMKMLMNMMIVMKALILETMEDVILEKEISEEVILEEEISEEVILEEEITEEVILGEVIVEVVEIRLQEFLTSQPSNTVWIWPSRLRFEPRIPTLPKYAS